MRLCKKAADFFREVFLRGAQLPAVGLLQVFLRRSDIGCRGFLCRGQVAGGERW